MLPYWNFHAILTEWHSTIQSNYSWSYSLGYVWHSFLLWKSRKSSVGGHGKSQPIKKFRRVLETPLRYSVGMLVQDVQYYLWWFYYSVVVSSSSRSFNFSTRKSAPYRTSSTMSLIFQLYTSHWHKGHSKLLRWRIRASDAILLLFFVSFFP